MKYAYTLVACLSLLNLSSKLFAQPGRGPSPVVVAEVIQQPVISGQSFVATTSAVRRAAVGSAVDGRVADYPINEGDFVKAGAPLARLLTATINLELKAAQSELELRRAELRELENGSRPEEIREAEAAMKAAKANQEYFAKKRQRAEELIRSNAINMDELQSIYSEQVGAEQQYQQMTEKYNLAKLGPREERIEQARAQVEIQQAMVEKLTDQVEKHTMKAPFDGFISVEHTELGQWVQRGELVAEVLAMNEMDIIGQVPEQYVHFVKLGSKVVVEIPAIPDQLFTGVVKIIIPQADVRSRTFPVKIRVTNQIEDNEPLIKSGMVARVTLPTGREQDSLLVPKDALVLGGPQKMVYMVVEGPEKQGLVVQPVPVNTGVASGELIQVTGQLAVGDKVVVRGNERLRPGQSVSILETLPTRSPGNEQGPAAETSPGTDLEQVQSE